MFWYLMWGKKEWNAVSIKLQTIPEHKWMKVDRFTGANSGSGTAYTSGPPLFTPCFSGVRVIRSFDICVMFCRSLFVLLFFFFWPLCCLSFDLRILITSLWYVQTLCTDSVQTSFSKCNRHCNTKNKTKVISNPTFSKQCLRNVCMLCNISLYCEQYIPQVIWVVCNSNERNKGYCV
jgi:hypothetical protein